MMFRSNNLAARVFERQILTPRPGTSVNLVRLFYENLVPSCTIYDVDCPDHGFHKFTDDGQYLVSFSRNCQDLIVYRPTWFSFSCKEEDCDSHSLPEKAKRFDSFFTQLYCVSLASSTEYICRQFFLYVQSHQFGLFATCTARCIDAPTTEGAIDEIPSIEKITFYLVRLEDGVILDEKAFCNDFVSLAEIMGVSFYEDLLCILSLRYQTLHVLQILNSGGLVDVRNIGIFCREDDELFLNTHAQITQGGYFLSGIKQRLLSFVFRRIWNEEADPTLRVQHLKEFYFRFQDFVDFIMWKMQFLDRHHLLIRFGHMDKGVDRITIQHPTFFAVYNMETTEIVAFYEDSSEELYSLFEQFWGDFHCSRNSLHANFISSHCNNIYALDEYRCMKNSANSTSQLFPIFHHVHSAERPVEFTSRRQPNVLNFKIKSGPEAGVPDGRPERSSLFRFHPYLPLALSIQRTNMQPTVVNIHFRR
ncbi:light-mediated development protein DET1 isoform X2 [Elaeis guineensis]|uniref:light-mediated development protein DET1 isoform X2 n=1 Tax=Elaeis guineensis var. tenera TaxID=51953 RepID=UPI003C6D116F